MLKFFISLLLTMLFTPLLLSKTINIDSRISNANKNNKKLLIYLHRDGCSYCNSMEEFTLDDDDIKEFIKRKFNIISINVSLDDDVIYNNQSRKAKYFAKYIGYNFYPTSLFLSKDGDVDYAAMGYKNEIEFLMILEYVLNNRFESIDLDKYKKILDSKKT